MGTRTRLRGKILLALAGILLLRFGWLYWKAGRVVARESWEVPSVVFGRPAAIHPGDPVDSLRLPDRLRRLGYRKVPGDPDRPGTWSEAEGRILLNLREFRRGEEFTPPGRAELRIAGGAVESILSGSGAEREELLLEPEEVARILGPGMESRRLVPLAAAPAHLRDAVLAAEDARFYRHHGLDFVGIARAAWANLRKLRFAQGGSTITQQLAKNFFLTPKKSLVRKIREAELALILEIRYSKDRILEAYLNKIYLGQEGPRGIYGVEEASRFYFSKGVSDLSLSESALLAALIRSPRRYSPFSAPAAAKERRDWILGRMASLGKIPPREKDRAVRLPVRVNPRKVPVRFAEYYVDFLERRVEEATGEADLSRRGYRIHSAMDPVHQEAAEKAVREGLAEISRRVAPGRRGRKADGEPLQAALAALDPRTGEITAIVGGRGYGETQYDRATDARRQPGSAFKPFVLLAAMEKAARGEGTATLATPLSGDPVTLQTPQGPWSPANFEGKTYGTVTVRTMIEQSVNTAAVRLALDTGLEEVVGAARAAGIESPLSAVPSVALGSYVVTPLELARAYATLAAGGIRPEAFALKSLSAEDGDALLTVRPNREPALDPRAAYLVTSALAGAVDRGTGFPARAAGLTFPVAGKTGTTDDYRDSWFVGYTPDLVCAVWVGLDSDRPAGLTGASGALEIWTRFLKTVYPSGTGRDFPVPDGISSVEIDPATGGIATLECPERVPEAFLSELVPTETCSLHPGNPLVESFRGGWRRLRDFLGDLFR